MCSKKKSVAGKREMNQTQAAGNCWLGERAAGNKAKTEVKIIPPPRVRVVCNIAVSQIKVQNTCILFK